MGKEEYKDNILRACYYNMNNGCGIEDFYFDNNATSDIYVILDELVKDSLINTKNNRYYITEKGINFVLSKSFCIPERPIVYS